MNYTIKEKLWFTYANVLATIAHWGQKRKWSNEPYITHPRSVANQLKEDNEPALAIVVALLHDVIEDTPLKYHWLRLLTGKDVADCVYTLSYIPERFPSSATNRALKKQWYFEQIVNHPKHADVCCSVKNADSADNFMSIYENDRDFFKVFEKEFDLFNQMCLDKRLEKRKLLVYLRHVVNEAGLDLPRIYKHPDNIPTGSAVCIGKRLGKSERRP